jgi:phosphopantothenoylcysteine decarboxylase / phosphopantothenate---cysteine ligase
MGYALAEEFANAGAEVVLLSGPVSVSAKHPSIKVEYVNSASEMYDACHRYFPEAGITVLSAAVADFTPAEKFTSKVKRGKEDWMVQLKPTRDIAASLGEIKSDTQVLVGFALETDNELNNAVRKLKRKNLDLIVLNSLKDKGAGFGTDTNKVSLIDKNNNIDNFELKSKKEVAKDIVEKIIRIKYHD